MIDIEYLFRRGLSKGTVAAVLLSGGLLVCVKARTGSVLFESGEQATATVLERNAGKQGPKATFESKPGLKKYTVKPEITGSSGTHRKTVSKGEYSRAIEGAIVPIVYTPRHPGQVFIGTRAERLEESKSRRALLPFGMLAAVAGAVLGAFALKTKFSDA